MLNYPDILSTLIGLLGLIVGIGGLIYARKQGIRMKKVNDLEQDYCKMKCKDLKEIINPLLSNTQELCMDIEKAKSIIDLKKDIDLGNASTLIRVISEQEGQLIYFFKKLNEEYEKKYNEKIFKKNIDNILPKVVCRNFGKYTGLIENNE